MKAFAWPFLIPLPSCPGREQVPVQWDHPNPSPSISGALRPPRPVLRSPRPHQGSKPHQATLFPCSSPATSSLPLRGPSWDVGWGLTHLPQPRHCPQCAQPAPACPCLAPGGHKGTVRANPSLALDASQKEQHQAAVGPAEPEGPGREGPPNLKPSAPTHLADGLHTLVAPGQNPVWVPLGTAHPPWGQKGWWELGSSVPSPA